MSLQPDELRIRILGYLLEWDHSGSAAIPDARTLAGKFGVSVSEILDQFDILESSGAARVERTAGDGSNSSALITGIGKRAYEDGAFGQSAGPMLSEQKPRNPNQVFVIHGRNEPLRESMFSFLRAIGLKPIEWNEAIAATKKPSPYIGEILDAAFREAQAIVVLASGDDEARLTSSLIKPADPAYEKQLSPQPRPNVLFEAGLAIGRQQDRTVIVQVGALRTWSDIAGKHITHLDNSVDKRNELANKLRIAGCQINLTGNDWIHTGDFGTSSIDDGISPRPDLPHGNAEIEPGEGSHSFSGAGTVTTKPFTIEIDPWVLRYSASWTGHFAVELRGASNELVVNSQVIADKLYETYVHGRQGHLHFAVVAAPPNGEWRLNVLLPKR